MSTEETITIEVDGQTLEARKGQMLIEVTDANGVYVPRFCYHKKLSVAANCRMCLVEVEKAPKPLPACATPVMDGMKVSTRSALALEAQKSVMEFLLINHPLDCPICDQGGECELQDLAMGYGSDVSRYQEGKRVVKDKDIGPLVQTDMTRCIHCTRCVRFGEEIAGLRELGATGRGEAMQIGTYVEKSMASEMSGNVIDLCPVGALTSKPFRFSARTWEMVQKSGIAAHDGIGSNIHFHIKDGRALRVVPAENESINEVWLSDRDRFSYAGLYSGDRLTTPMIKKDGNWVEVAWETAFATIKERLGNVVETAGPQKIGALISPAATTEELYLLQKLMRGMGSDNIDHRLRQCDFRDQEHAPPYPWLGLSLAGLAQVDAALIIGANPRKDQPILNHRLRKAAGAGGHIMAVNPIDYDFNYPLAAKLITPPDELAGALAGIAKALLESAGGAGDQILLELTKDIQIDATQRQVAGLLKSAGNGVVLLGRLANAHPEFTTLRYLAGMIAKMTGTAFGYLEDGANSAGAWLAGALPHRQPGGAASNRAHGFNSHAMFEQRLSAYLLFNLEPELDCWDSRLALDALNDAQTVILFTPYRTAAMEAYGDVLLPIAHYGENEGSYINVAGTRQRFAAVLTPAGESRPGWKVLRVLGNTLGVEGFDYNTLSDINNELEGIVTRCEPGNLEAWRKPDAIAKGNGGCQRVTDLPMNSLDPLVRRAAALQQTSDVADGSVHINDSYAQQLGVQDAEQVQVSQNGTRVKLPLSIDNRLPDRAVLIEAGHQASSGLGPWFGEISIERF